MSEVYFLVLEDGRMKQVASLRGKLRRSKSLQGRHYFWHPMRRSI